LFFARVSDRTIPGDDPACFDVTQGPAKKVAFQY
jgi:hypothetical protein